MVKGPSPVDKRKAGFALSIYCPIEKELRIQLVKKYLKAQHETLSEFLMKQIDQCYEEFIAPHINNNEV